MSTDHFDTHRKRLEDAQAALATRSAHTAFRESPSTRVHGEEAPRAGKAAFEARLGQRFAIDQPGTIDWIGEEISPYTGEALGISYPRCDVDTLFGAARAAMPAWRDAGPRARVGLCLEMLAQLADRAFENAHAVMHTAGQSYAMAYAGSGPNALDRGLEALALAWQAQQQVPGEARWQKRFGKDEVVLEKRYRIMPLGPAVVFCCATFPTWNAHPAIFANLATGNPVLVKPHPGCVLPMAITVETLRKVLADNGHDPNLVQLCVDSTTAPLGKVLVEHPQAAIIDFTGSARFGSWVEAHAGGRPCYTETSGVNSVVIESCDSLPAMAAAIAGSVCLFSSQMCTSPQNIYVPAGGIDSAAGHHSADEVRAAIVAAIDAIAEAPARAASVMGTIQSRDTLRLIEHWQQRGAEAGTVLRRSAAYLHPEHPQAWTATPLVIGLGIDRHELYSDEVFGPIAFIIEAADADQALAQATRDAREHGAITAFAYSANEAWLERAEAAFAEAGAALTENLTGAMPLNFAAAYSDLHVSGLNPAGNASLADWSFVAGRFRIAQARRPVSARAQAAG
ncbi:MAG: phenylacetic acid degradation protein PaaN [Gammaproteobacteria bacterium]|nr:MAG: phenylacetic acid degradation protein PaaN [Gammaproteobacteria bacterium]